MELHGKRQLRTWKFGGGDALEQRTLHERRVGSAQMTPALSVAQTRKQRDGAPLARACSRAGRVRAGPVFQRLLLGEEVVVVTDDVRVRELLHDRELTVLVAVVESHPLDSHNLAAAAFNGAPDRAKGAIANSLQNKVMTVIPS